MIERPRMTTRLAGVTGCGSRVRAVMTFALLAASTTLGGCSIKLMGHQIGFASRHPSAPERPRLDDLAAAREQATLQPHEPYWPFRLAQLELAADSVASAEHHLNVSLARDKTYAPALTLLSKIYYDAGRHAEGVRMLEPVRTQPAAFASDARGALLADLALHEAALGQSDPGALAAVASGHPDLKRAGPALVWLGLLGAHPDSAAGLAERVLQAGPRSAVNLNNFGITRLRAGDPIAARKAFTDAIDRDPDLPGPYYNLAILEKYYLFDDAAASRSFKSYWKRSQTDPDSLLGVFGGSEQRAIAEKGTGR